MFGRVCKWIGEDLWVHILQVMGCAWREVACEDMAGLCLDRQVMILDRKDMMICDGWKRYLDKAWLMVGVMVIEQV